MHINISTELVSKYNSLRLEQVSGLEQSMACGDDAQGKPYKTALSDLKAFLGSEELPLSPGATGAEQNVFAVRPAGRPDRLLC